MYIIVDKRILRNVWCGAHIDAAWFPKTFRLYFCKISFKLVVAKVALRVAKKDTKISEYYMQYTDYNDIYQKGSQ